MTRKRINKRAWLMVLPFVLGACADAAETPLRVTGPDGEPIELSAAIETHRGADHAEQGAGCQSSCSLAPPKPLRDYKIKELLQQVGQARLGEPTLALETLLFHRASTEAFLLARPSGLDAEREGFLKEELRRTHAIVEMRVVDAAGTVRARLEETRVPLGEKRHLHFAQYNDVQPFEASGTVTRTGLGHIWSRY